MESAWKARGWVSRDQGTHGGTISAEQPFGGDPQDGEESGRSQFNLEGVPSLLAQFPWSEAGSLEEAALAKGVLHPVLELGSRLASATSDQLGDADLHLLAALFEVCPGPAFCLQ